MKNYSLKSLALLMFLLFGNFLPANSQKATSIDKDP